MFDFKNLKVYQKSLALNANVFEFLRKNPQIDYYLKDQFKRAATSISLNIAEGSGRLTRADKNRFYTIARSSAYEVVAIIDILKGQYPLSENSCNEFVTMTDEISRMLFGLIKNSVTKKL